MIMDIINQVKQFWTGPAFWWRHAVGFSLAWLVFSFIGILIKKYSKWRFATMLHQYLQLIADLMSMFFVFGPLYRIYVNTDNYGEINTWPILFLLHIIFGVLFGIAVITQHIIGIKLKYFGGKASLHKYFGILISLFARIMISFGYFISHQLMNSLITGIIGLVQMLILTYNVPSTTQINSKISLQKQQKRQKRQ